MKERIFYHKNGIGEDLFLVSARGLVKIFFTLWHCHKPMKKMEVELVETHNLRSVKGKRTRLDIPVAYCSQCNETRKYQPFSAP